MKQLFSLSLYIYKIFRRSRTVYAALFLSVMAVLAPIWLVPNSSATAQGVITSIKFSMSFLSIVALLGTTWVGCIFASGQIETWRIHLLRVRPISPFGIVLAQIIGVFSVFVLPLLGSVLLLACTGSYLSSQLSAEESIFLKERLLTVKERITAELPDVSEAAVLKTKQHISETGMPENYSQQMLVDEYSDQLLVRSGEVPPLGLVNFLFTNVNPGENPLFIAYKVKASGRFNPEMKVFCDVTWYLKHPVSGNFYPMETRCPSGSSQKFQISPDFISEDGTVLASFQNSGRHLIYFSVATRPEIVIEKSGIFGNIFRTIIYTLLVLLFFSTLGIVSGMLFSTPVAMFFCFVYMVFGVLADLQLLRTATTKFLTTVTISPFSNDAIVNFCDGLQVSTSFLFINGSVLFLVSLLISWLASLVLEKRELALVFRRN